MRSLLLALCLAFAGCATSGTVTIPALPAWQAPVGYGPITGQHVQIYAAAHLGTVPVFVADSTYTALNHDWFEAFLLWEWEVANELGISYVPESFDCDDFAVGFTWAVSRAAAKARVRVAPLVARIVVALPTSPPTRHAMVGVVTDRGVYVVEPQPDAGPFRTKLLSEYDKSKILSVVFGDYNP